MKKARKILSLVLASLMAASALAGCNSQPSPGSEEPASQGTSGESSVPEGSKEEAGTAAKDVTIQVICPSNQQEFPEGVTPNENFIVDYWKEKTGFNFDIVVLPLENSEEKLNIMFNSGEVTGIAFTRDPGKVGTLAAQDLLAPVDDYMKDSAFFQKFADYQTMGQYDGKQYGVGIPPDGIPYEGGIIFGRKDVLTQGGMAEQPKTLEDFTKSLEILKEQGMTVPLAIGGSPVSKGFDGLLAMFGIASDDYGKYFVKDDKIEYKMTSENAREYLKYVTKLYADGLIPQDFTALNTAAAINELYLSGKAGMVMTGSIWDMPGVMTQSEELNFDTRFIDYPTGYDGSKSYGDFGRVGVSVMGLVSKDCKDVASVVKFLDFLIEPETLMINNFGIEGEHYNMVESVPTPTDKAKDIAWGVYYRNVFLPEDWYTVYGIGANWAEYYYPSERNSVGNPACDPIAHMPVNSDLKTRHADLTKTIVAPYFTKVITGEDSIDNFDKFVQEWLAAGGQEELDYYNQLWSDMGKPTFTAVSYLPEEHPAYTGKYLWDGKE